ncbi:MULTISPECIES: LysM peptidoglycan-binding domain-containing protein [unclassified Acinetobacter]|uniref:LysM peptidoglycan-binding domain-containing protein n=1 Tax=unclassified Acinetobacter TaxID=196816 RepID=UPI003AF59A87
MTNTKKSLITIKIVDLFGNPISKLEYQVKNQRSGEIIAAGPTNSAGCIVEISRDKGTIIDVYIKNMFTGKMGKVQSFVMSKDRMLVKIISPKVLLDLNTFTTQGNNGQYKRKTHIVKKNETLGSIASQNHTTVRALERLNKIDDPDKIFAGQVLKLPVDIPATGSNSHQDKPKQKPKTPTTQTKTKVPPQTSKNPSKTTQQPKANTGILGTLGDLGNKALEQANDLYEEGKKTFNGAMGSVTKILTVDDRSQDGGTPKSNASNLCKTSPQCIDKGNSELIREVNIRLAGFGGALPTDEFSELTAKSIRQFQQDYMGVQPTGKICGGLLAALDKFSEEYDIKKYFSQMKCDCGKCKGFGNGKKANGEHPGIHRSVLNILRAVIFYLEKVHKNEKFTFQKIGSGYRCTINNQQHNRATINHMGLALDLHFNKNSTRTKSTADMNHIRSSILGKYMGASTQRVDNKIYLEPDKAVSRKTGKLVDLANTWVHFDITYFSKKYFNDDLFANSIAEIDKGGVFALAQKSNEKILSCAGVFSKVVAPPQQLKSGASIGGIIGKVIASHESGGDYNIFNRGTVGKYKWTSGREDIAKRTIDEWVDLGELSGNNINKRFAMGKYQIIPDTLSGIKKSMKFTGNENITNELQERMFKEHFVKPTIIYRAIIHGDNKTITEACMHIAKIWASVGIPYATTRTAKKVVIPLSKGSSYWAGVGGNKAHTSSESVISALKQMNSDYVKLIASGKNSEQAFDLIMSTDKAIYN